MMTNTFEYTRQSRTPGAYFSLGVGMAMAYLSWTLHLPMWVWAASAVFLCVVLWRLAANPKCGFRLGDTALEYFHNRARRSVAYRDLVCVTIGANESGSSVCVLCLTDGSTATLPGTAAMPTEILIREFRNRGVCVAY